MADEPQLPPPIWRLPPPKPSRKERILRVVLGVFTAVMALPAAAFAALCTCGPISFGGAIGPSNMQLIVPALVGLGVLVGMLVLAGKLFDGGQ